MLALAAAKSRRSTSHHLNNSPARILIPLPPLSTPRCDITPLSSPVRREGGEDPECDLKEDQDPVLITSAGAVSSAPFPLRGLMLSISMVHFSDGSGEKGLGIPGASGAFALNCDHQRGKGENKE